MANSNEWGLGEELGSTEKVAINALLCATVQEALLIALLRTLYENGTMGRQDLEGALDIAAKDLAGRFPTRARDGLRARLTAELRRIGAQALPARSTR